VNLSGVLVVAKPEWLGQVVDALKILDGVEVHQVEADSGRIIVVQEASDIHAEIDGLKRIKALPHVIMAEMVYHYIGDDERTYEGLPEELQDEKEGFDSSVVPAYLNS